MICFRNIKEDDKDKIKNILIEEKVDDFQFDGIIYVVSDDDKIIGVGKVTEEESKWFIKYLIIDKQLRKQGLGDGLLRAILNKIINNGIDKVYFKGYNEFLVDKGFKINDDILELYIEDLFNHSCGGCNEL